MLQRVRPGRRPLGGRLAGVAALLALLCQIVLSGMMSAEPVRAERVALSAAGVLCSSGNVPADGHRRPQHHRLDLALCPAIMALELPSSILAPTLLSPPPAVRLVLRVFERPVGRAPPGPVMRVGSPRGPPAAA